MEQCAREAQREKDVTFYRLCWHNLNLLRWVLGGGGEGFEEMMEANRQLVAQHERKRVN